MRNLLERLVMFLCSKSNIPMPVRLYLLSELPFNLSPMQKVELTAEQRQGAIDYIKSHPELLK